MKLNALFFVAIVIYSTAGSAGLGGGEAEGEG